MDPAHDDFGNPIPTVSEWFGGRQPAASDGQRIAELEAELHAIKYEVMGGEDAPGSASMATVADVKKEIDRLRGIEFAARSLAERLYKFE